MMGLFSSIFGGGGSSSSSSSSSTTYNTTDKRLVVDNGGIGVTGDNTALTINTLDGGAVAAMKSTAGAGLDLASTLGKRAIDSADSTVEQAAALTLELLNKNNQNAAQALTFAQNASERALTFAFDAGKPDAALTQKWGQWIAIVGGILAAGVALKNLKGAG